MSVMAIADFLDGSDLIERAKIDVAIPFIQGRFGRVHLYVMRLKAIGRPKIHRVAGADCWGSPKNVDKWIFYPNWQ